MKILSRILSLTMIFCAMAALSACDDDDYSQVAVDVRGVSKNAQMYSGDVLELDIYVVAHDTRLTNFLIESYDTRTGNKILLEKPLNGSTEEIKYYYTAPAIDTDELNVRLSFTATDDTGYKRTVTREIKVLRRDQPLEERSGVTLYCDEDNASRPDGYSFAEMRPLIVSLVEPTLVDLYIPAVNPEDLPNPDDMPAVVREWRTMTDINFARSNSFDFSNATSINITSAYQSSVRAPRITNLHSGDIVLVGRGAKPVAAVQIVDIIVGQSLQQSRYILNIKAIKSVPQDAPDEPDGPDNPDTPNDPGEPQE